MSVGRFRWTGTYTSIVEAVSTFIRSRRTDYNLYRIAFSHPRSLYRRGSMHGACDIKLNDIFVTARGHAHPELTLLLSPFTLRSANASRQSMCGTSRLVSSRAYPNVRGYA